ncbi:S1 RNA-binding domain-containing protein [Candidatus Peregrinibacteria bacterium]|jgi:small subunit ribosomal protein S1|nr:S1 RNA-binding domain-containing protein [Candidatus Peregrinibacteria bacterium]MBT7703847.1 S1 RNA-binding domain-containing protein [Candidatus Peregrinibacteria bacterium]
MAATQTISMEELLKSSPDMILPEPGELLEGNVISVGKHRILVDIGGVNTGIISGRETKDSMNTIKDLAPGDAVYSCVLESENEDGFVLLSLRKASQERAWKRFADAYDENDVVEVKPTEANKGGLLLEVDGIKGFIPVSQLAPLHYPRVNGADANLILQKLKKLVGVSLSVKIINLDKQNGKLILSERAAFQEERKAALGKITIGTKVKGKISGVVNFGIFVAFEGLEGLVHISEIAWGHVKNPSDHGKVGDEVEVQIIGIEGDKISLSMKRLMADPWADAAKTFKVGSVIKGEITRLAPFGAFMKLTDDINGLIHLSEIVREDGTPVNEPSEVLRSGEKVEAKVIDVNLDEHRIGLSLKALNEKAMALAEEKAKDKEEAKEEKAEEASEEEATEE